MANTYDSTSIATTLAKVRLRIGDTRSTTEDWLLTDEEITIAINDSKYDVTARPDDVMLIAVDCIEFILAKIARDVDSNAAGFNANRSQKTQHYKDLRKDLLEKYERFNGRVSVTAETTFTGVSVSELAELDADADYIDRSTQWDNLQGG